jgi:hypothetical protein
VPPPGTAAEPIRCPPVVTAPAVGPARDRGVLWRLSRDGRSSWLFGTLHVGRPDWRSFGPRTAAALRGSDLLALEIDPTDPAVIAALTIGHEGFPLSPELAARLARATERACLPASALAALHPVLQATTLTVLDARWLGLDPAYSLEVLLAERTRSGAAAPAGRAVKGGPSAPSRIVSLESVETQKAALVPRDTAEAIALVDASLAQIEDGTSRRVLDRLARAWERGDLAELEDYGSWCECAASDDERVFMRRLIDERNAPLADAVAAWHARGQRVFAAVGALHMVGEAALPKLMAARGFRVERIVFAP